MAKLQQLKEHLERHLPHVHYATPKTLNCKELREAFIIDNTTVPLAIVRPKTADDVASLIQFAVAAGIEITVRTGGHDLYGRCFAQDALALDMRDISFVHVAGDRTWASLGGGILTGDLAADLAAHKLATAMGSVSSVGYVGWATHGGYGAFTSNFGLGADQVLAAKVVNHEGKIVEADADMLCALRGGGGTLGVIIELTVKAYPLDKILGGVIMIESSDLASTIQRFEFGYRDMVKHGAPEALSIEHHVANTPMGKALTVGFVWSSSDFKEGRRWLDNMSSLGTVLFSGVKETAIPDWMKEAEAFVPKSAYGCNLSVNVGELTDEVIQVIATQVLKMPNDPATLLTIQELRGPSASPKDNSVYRTRTPHYIVEFIDTSSDAIRAAVAWEWANGFRKAIKTTDPKHVLPATYISLTPPAESTLAMIYHESRDELVRLKKRYDPSNVFRHALPNF